MQRTIWRLPAALALAAATWLPSARAADLISFDDPALANLYGGFEEIALGDYRAYFQSDGGLIGGAGDLPESTAPVGNSTSFATALNAGVFSLFRADGESFDLLGFDFAYVPHPDAPPPLRPMILVILGGATIEGGWRVEPAVSGQPFTRFDDPAEMAPYRNVTSLSFTICSFDPDTNEVCTFTLGSDGQFALDNLVVQSAIPEPATALLWGAGLALVARRRWRQRGPAAAGAAAKTAPDQTPA